MANTDSTVQIIPYYSHPHVHTVIVDNSGYEETVTQPAVADDLPYSTMIVTGADSGIDGTFVRLTDLAVKTKLFGKGNYPKYGQPSIQADQLFNGQTNVWFCRALPANAIYANKIFLAHFRKGKVLDDLNQETGKVHLEIKFSAVSLTKDLVPGGALTDDAIDAYARSLVSLTADPLTGYMTVPIFFVRSIGRGQYGNSYSISVTRDTNAEKEYEMKMYRFTLLDNSGVTRQINEFAGSLIQGVKDNASTLISDVLDQYSKGSCPISITPYDEYMNTIYTFYKTQIVNANLRYLTQSHAGADDMAEVQTAQAITEEKFDPLFGLVYGTRVDEQIPYYKNYTVKSTGAWVAPNLEVPNVVGATKPLNMRDWSAAFVGARVLVAADPLHHGYRWIYTVVGIQSGTGNIVYDEGESCAIDDDQYTGDNLALSVGHIFDGGHDGDFQEITVDGQTRVPTATEMKLLLAREYVKIFRGEKDRRILSPSRINLDMVFDANYNMTSDETLAVESSYLALFNSSTVLTDKDAAALSVLAQSNTFEVAYTDLNVKRALYDLIEFRNRNGMKMNLDYGAGCSLYLDCGLVGIKNIGVNEELQAVLDMMEDFTGRQTSIDLGYYEIFDPNTAKRVKVTVTYFMAKNLIPHIMKEGLNKPFTHKFAQITTIQTDNTLVKPGDMIRDSFMPDIDLIDWDVKEALYKSRINYWTTSDEGRVVQRECQNTRQLEASALLEENNVRVLNILKKNLEKACSNYSYEWNEPEVRKGYTEAQMLVYKPWIGTMVEDLQIVFRANEFEQGRMMMHCYVEVKFRDIVKRIILEINIQRPSYSEDMTA